MLMKRWLEVFFVLVVFLFTRNASALTFTANTLTGTSYSFLFGDKSASADFTFSGDSLAIQLTNTFGGDVPNPTHVLGALFFDLTLNTQLIATSALLGPGSTVLYGPDGGGNVSGEWAYNNNLSGTPTGALQGVSATGYGIFSPSDVIPSGVNLAGPVAVNGMGYGIVSTGYSAGGNAAVTGQFPLIHDSVVFSFTGASGLGISDVFNVSFEYGTELGPAIPPTSVPEPTSMLLLGSGMALSVCANALRKKNRFGIGSRQYRRVSIPFASLGSVTE
jgi:hypothetical protein